jgi:hypothetical protein
MFPKECTIIQSYGAKVAVIAGNEQSITPRRWCETHRATGEERPPQLSATGVDGNNLVLCRTAEDHGIVDDDGLIGKIKRNA